MSNKTIHYCWFGGNPLPELVVKCMESWKRFCPEYEIICWDESNFDINCCVYVREAYEAKKWAFVSDYCRFYVLHRYGGIYLDTDVELLKPLDQLPDTFIGFENPSTCASGLIRGALPGDEICKRMLESYEKDIFRYPDGQYNTKTVCQRETAILEAMGLKRNGQFQIVGDTTVYPAEYFCPMGYMEDTPRITERTVSIHHYGASWYGDMEKYAAELNRKMRAFLPRKLAKMLSVFVARVKYDGFAGCLRYIRRKLGSR